MTCSKSDTKTANVAGDTHSQKEKAALTGLILPSFPILAFGLLVLLSLTNSTVSSIIVVDKLILLVVALSPVVYVAGAIISIIALVKSQMKITAFAGAAVNIGLLIFLLYFGKSFLMEFSFIS